MRYRYAVIGLGRVGSAMLELLRDAGHEPAWAVSSREHDLDVPLFKEIPPETHGAKVVFIATPDGRIRVVAERIRALWGKTCREVVFLHFSGLLTSSELDSLAQEGAAVGSLHPLQSITDAAAARQVLKGSVFTFEGAEGAKETARAVVDSLGGLMMTISGEDKVLYHASAVVASNYLVALLDEASQMIFSIGMDLKNLMPLVRGTLANIEARGGKALTGPISRGDWDTVRRHVKALEKDFPDLLETYLALGRHAARMTGDRLPEGLTGGSKLIALDELCRVLEVKRGRGMKVVFTNGCFDIIHAGHVTYLAKARALGDCLVLGLNADSSVRRLKGSERPVNTQEARAAVLGGLECIDHVVVFEEDTPLRLIERVRPDILVKGGDWAVEDIVGSDVVRSSGGKVLTIPFEDGFSTSSIIGKIRQE